MCVYTHIYIYTYIHIYVYIYTSNIGARTNTPLTLNQLEDCISSVSLPLRSVVPKAPGAFRMPPSGYGLALASEDQVGFNWVSPSADFEALWAGLN